MPGSCQITVPSSPASPWHGFLRPLPLRVWFSAADSALSKVGLLTAPTWVLLPLLEFLPQSWKQQSVERPWRVQECAGGLLCFILFFSRRGVDCLQFTVEGIEDWGSGLLSGSSNGIDADRLSY